MILAIVLICLAIALGLGGLLFKFAVWVFILAAALFVVGAVLGVMDRRKIR